MRRAPWTQERIMSAVVVVEDCWEWALYRDREGYGKTGSGSLAHREAYAAFVGPIPTGLTIDHLCGNPGCVKPAHLEPVPIGVNVLRGTRGACAVNARKTHCVHGHELSGRNLLARPRNQRGCRECMNEAQRRYQRRKAGKA